MTKLRSYFGPITLKSKVLTVDRKMSGIGYAEHNCCMSCSLCNRIKGYIIPAEQYKSIAVDTIANIVNICKEAGLEI